MKNNFIVVKRVIRIVRIGLISLSIFLILFLFYKDFVPSGIFIVENSIKKRSAVFSDFYPPVRIREKECNQEGECWRTMICDPVYFEITTPRSFDRGELIIKYKNYGQDVFQLGLQKRGEWRFQFHPLENKILDNLSWPSLRNGGLILFQKSNDYSSLKNFFSHLPYDKKIGLFYYSFPKEIMNKFKIKPVILKDKFNPQDFDYILAAYSPPKNENGWQVSEVNFTIPPEYFIGRKLKFMLSAPEMDFKRSKIQIKDIKVILYRQPITLDNFFPRFKRYLKRLFRIK